MQRHCNSLNQEDLFMFAALIAYFYFRVISKFYDSVADILQGFSFKFYV